MSVDNLKMIVAIERFKADLAELGMSQLMITEALELAVELTEDMDLIDALHYVRDQKMFERNHRWDSETTGATSSGANTKDH